MTATSRPRSSHHQALFGLPPALSAHDRGFYSPAAIRACETAGVATECIPQRGHPVRPLTGPGDWLAQVRWVGGAPDPRLQPRSRPAPAGGWRPAHHQSPARRKELIQALLAVLGDGRGEPALHALLREDHRLVESALGGHEDLTRFRRHLRTLRQRLYPYQSDGVERFLVGGRLLLADDIGLGKTARAIAACHALGHTGRVRRGLLCVPAALKPQWLRERHLFTDAPADVIDGNPAHRRAAFGACRRGFLLLNYEQLIRDLEVVRAWNPDLVVLDEAQRIKNWATKTALTVKQLDPPYRLVLTGTPMENRLEELASIVEWVDDRALEPKWRLAPWHTTPVDGTAAVGGARNLDTLRVRLAGCMVRRIRQEVLSQLPSRTDTRIPIEMTAEQIDEHDGLTVPIASLLARAKRRPLTRAEFLKLMTLLTTQRIIANGLAQLRFEEIWPDVSRIDCPTEATLKGLASPKLLELRELIRQIALDQERKVVVFSQWRRMLRLAHWATRDLLAQEGVRAAFFTGAEGQARRRRTSSTSTTSPPAGSCSRPTRGGRPQPPARGERVHQHRAALEPGRPGAAHRPDLPPRQKRPIDVYNLVSEPGIESRIADLVGNKRALFTGLFDGASDEVTFERAGSFLSKIEHIVAPLPALTPARGAESAERDDDPAEREIDATVAAADESHGPPAALAFPPAAAPSADHVQKLFEGLTARRTPNGGLLIEAPPETTSTLAALFAGMAQLLQGAAGAHEPR